MAELEVIDYQSEVKVRIVLLAEGIHHGSVDHEFWICMFQHTLDRLGILDDLLYGLVGISHAVHAALTDCRLQVAALDVRIDHRQKLLELSLRRIKLTRRWLLVMQVLNLLQLHFLLHLLILLDLLLLLILGEFVLLTLIVEVLHLDFDYILLLFSEDREGGGEAGVDVLGH